MTPSGMTTLWVGPSDPPEDVLAEAGCALIARARDGLEGLRLIEEAGPEVVLAEALLPGVDGAGFALRAAALPLLVRPALILLRLPCMPLLGLDSPGDYGAAVLEKPFAAASLRAAITALIAHRGLLPPRKAARLTALLDALGVPEHPGRACLAAAVGLVWSDRRLLRALGGRLYPEVGLRCGRSAAQVERAIRHVIDAAWRTGDMAQQQRIFGDTIDAKRGRPTCGEMIAQLADILRWEG